MQSVYVFLDIAKFADFRWKNADVNRIQGVCHVIHIFFGPTLGKVWLCQVSSLWDVCDWFYGGGVPILNMVKVLKFYQIIFWHLPVVSIDL